MTEPYLSPVSEDEPFFTVRGRDPAAVDTIQKWIDKRRELIYSGILPDNDEEQEHLHRAIQKQEEIRQFQPKSFGKHTP